MQVSLVKSLMMQVVSLHLRKYKQTLVMFVMHLQKEYACSQEYLIKSKRTTVAAGCATIAFSITLAVHIQELVPWL